MQSTYATNATTGDTRQPISGGSSLAISGPTRLISKAKQASNVCHCK
jgi:hypothetical protein